jgi:hypothetical protein
MTTPMIHRQVRPETATCNNFGDPAYDNLNIRTTDGATVGVSVLTGEGLVFEQDGSTTPFKLDPEFVATLLARDIETRLPDETDDGAWIRRGGEA